MAANAGFANAWTLIWNFGIDDPRCQNILVYFNAGDINFNIGNAIGDVGDGKYNEASGLSQQGLDDFNNNQLYVSAAIKFDAAAAKYALSKDDFASAKSYFTTAAYYYQFGIDEFGPW